MEFKEPIYEREYMINVTIDDVLAKNMIDECARLVSSKHRMPGVDNIDSEKFPAWWIENKEQILESIRNGSYIPHAAFLVMISKNASSKKRRLEIPCMVDKVIETAIHKTLSPEFDKTFSVNSYGFISGRGTSPALYKCLEFLNGGKQYILDLDIASFFDNVSHEPIKKRLGEELCDEILKELIIKYMRTRVVTRNGAVYAKRKGVSQGSPLSPLLANIALDRLDKELDWRNIKYVRYADDIAIFCDCKKEAIDTLIFVNSYLSNELHLYLNKEKTKVVKPEEFKFLGYSFTKMNGKYVFAVDNENVEKVKVKIEKHLNCKRKQTDIDRINRIGAFNRGWLNYYMLAEENSLFRLIKCADRTELNILREMVVNNTELVKCLYDSKQFVSMEEWYNTILSR